MRDGFYTNIAFFRCVDRFLTQFGISVDPAKKHWHRKEILDDPMPHNNKIKKYMVSYAGSGPNSRSTQLFIAFEDLDFLGKAPWEVPFGRVVDGFSVVDSLYKGYGDIPPYGKGPDQQKIHNRGAAYLQESFPNLDYLQSCRVVDAPVLLRGSALAQNDQPGPAIEADPPRHSISNDALTAPAPVALSTVAPTKVLKAAKVPAGSPRPRLLVDAGKVDHRYEELHVPTSSEKQDVGLFLVLAGFSAVVVVCFVAQMTFRYSPRDEKSN